MIQALGHQCFKSQEGPLSAALGNMKSKRRPEGQLYLAPGQGASLRGDAHPLSRDPGPKVLASGHFSIPASWVPGL